ncbi:MAG TPA: PIG-L deacetylase family protein [Candidatus Tectomicrobia bacterium]|nr:PIG-L deacetylase family protein [Candidatus Tectomicrobia bacterium]
MTTRASRRAARGGYEMAASLRTILCIAAHPDDNEFLIAGSVARWTREGRDVLFCLVTTGGAGTNEHTPSAEGLIPIRERETREAARILGVRDVIFLGYQDGVLEPTIGLRRDLTRVIRRVRPDVVVCGDPTQRWYGNEYLNHPDHRAAASAALDAVFPSAETRAIFPELLTEGLEPHKVKEVLITGAVPADTFVDVAETLATKCAALRAHASQVGPGEGIEPLLRGWAAEAGKRAGLAAAEGFRRIVLNGG